MTDSPDNPNRWIDGELRRVPLPDGLLAKLRAIAQNGADDALDDQICAVELPDGLLARLLSIPDDELLDRRIANAPLPDELLVRLAQIPDDEQLDERVRDVPLPDSLSPAKLVPATIAAVRRETAQRLMRQLSVAAAVLLAVGSGYFAVLDRFSNALFVAPQTLGPREPDSSGEIEPPSWEPEASEVLFTFGPADGSAERNAVDMRDLWADAGASSTVALAGQFRRPSALDIASTWPATDEDAARFGARPHPLELPPLEAAVPVAAYGVDPPAIAGYDRLALARTGVHPFVDPSKHPLLESAAAPLARSTASFDALLSRLRDDARRGMENRRTDTPYVLSAASVRVRTEEFLAAMRYDFPPPTNSAVAIRTAAGPSPFAGSGIRLLQVGVQAASLSAATRNPVELTIAVDVAHRMGRGGRLDMVRAALGDLLRGMRADDRISLVAMGSTVDVLVERVSPGDAALADAIERLAAESGTNFHAGIERAAALARLSAAAAASSSARPQLVVLADAPTFVTQAQRSASQRSLASLTDANVSVAVLDLSLAALPDEGLASLARSSGGKLERITSAADARRTLNEALFARSTVVAQDVALSLRFNPRSVASYRLVGHEATFGLPTSPVNVSLRSGESATVLFEVVLRGDGTNDVGTAELEWIDPNSRKKQLLTQPISRVQFANSLAESAISLQAAAVAAEAAEILRGARTATSPAEHSLDRTLEVARAVHPRLREQAEFRGLVELIERARQAGLGRTAP
jgi:Ca-activated chloride channel family protein